MIRPGDQGRRWREPGVVAGDAWQRLVAARSIVWLGGYTKRRGGVSAVAVSLRPRPFLMELEGLGLQPIGLLRLNESYCWRNSVGRLRYAYA